MKIYIFQPQFIDNTNFIIGQNTVIYAESKIQALEFLFDNFPELEKMKYNAEFATLGELIIFERELTPGVIFHVDEKELEEQISKLEKKINRIFKIEPIEDAMEIYNSLDKSSLKMKIFLNNYNEIDKFNS